MPLLGSLILGLFSGLAGFFAQWMTKKVAIVAAGVAAFGVLTAGVFVACLAAINGLIVVFPNQPAMMVGLWLAVPDNAPLVVSTVLAFDATLAVYRWNLYVVNLASHGG